jgi:hypothetical protein
VFALPESATDSDCLIKVALVELPWTVHTLDAVQAYRF